MCANRHAESRAIGRHKGPPFCIRSCAKLFRGKGINEVKNLVRDPLVRVYRRHKKARFMGGPHGEEMRLFMTVYLQAFTRPVTDFDNHGVIIKRPFARA